MIKKIDLEKMAVIKIKNINGVQSVIPLMCSKKSEDGNLTVYEFSRFYKSLEDIVKKYNEILDFVYKNIEEAVKEYHCSHDDAIRLYTGLSEGFALKYIKDTAIDENTPEGIYYVVSKALCAETLIKYEEVQCKYLDADTPEEIKKIDEEYDSLFNFLFLDLDTKYEDLSNEVNSLKNYLEDNRDDSNENYLYDDDEDDDWDDDDWNINDDDWDDDDDDCCFEFPVQNNSANDINNLLTNCLESTATSPLRVESLLRLYKNSKDKQNFALVFKCLAGLDFSAFIKSSISYIEAEEFNNKLKKEFDSEYFKIVVQPDTSDFQVTDMNGINFATGIQTAKEAYAVAAKAYEALIELDT